MGTRMFTVISVNLFLFELAYLNQDSTYLSLLIGTNIETEGVGYSAIVRYYCAARIPRNILRIL